MGNDLSVVDLQDGFDLTHPLDVISNLVDANDKAVKALVPVLWTAMLAKPRRLLYTLLPGCHVHGLELGP